jgi:hypothetical protein
MALLSRMFRTVPITGRTDTINAWFADIAIASSTASRWLPVASAGAPPVADSVK